MSIFHSLNTSPNLVVKLVYKSAQYNSFYNSTAVEMAQALLPNWLVGPITYRDLWGCNNYCVLVPETQAALRQQELCKMWSRHESRKAKGCFMWFGMEMHKEKM